MFIHHLSQLICVFVLRPPHQKPQPTTHNSNLIVANNEPRHYCFSRTVADTMKQIFNHLRRATARRSFVHNSQAIRRHDIHSLLTTAQDIAAPSKCQFQMKTDHVHLRLPPTQTNQIRTFKNVAEYHNVADDTLHNIQDALEELIEDNFLSGGDDDEIPEVNYANGVLTISLPPHGTWVINKQTPNEQLWWSSPISGPRRYEYVEERERWIYTRVIDGESGVGSAEGENDTLGQILVEEIQKLYGCDLQLEA